MEHIDMTLSEFPLGESCTNKATVTIIFLCTFIRPNEQLYFLLLFKKGIDIFGQDKMNLIYSIENGSDKITFHMRETQPDTTLSSTERPRNVWETVFVQYDFLSTQILGLFPSTINSSRQEERGSIMRTSDVKAVVGLNR